MTIKSKTISDLRRSLKGRVIGPQDADFNSARTVFYGGIDRRPGAIIRVANSSDVSRAVAWARETGMELAVRSGGHSIAGHSLSEGGLVLDFKEMRASGSRSRTP